MIYKKIYVLLIVVLTVCSLFFSCNSVQSKKIHDADGIMYGMIYDFDNLAVNDVQIFIDEKKIENSDIQGRFIFSSSKESDHRIELRKSGYETIMQSFKFDTMNVLYFKMINTSQLVNLAESALDTSSYDTAVAYLDRAEALVSERADILFLKAIIFYRKGDFVAASETISKMEKLGYGDESTIALGEKIKQEVDKK